MTTKLLYPYEHRLPACLFYGSSVVCVMSICRLVRSLQKGTIMENMNVNTQNTMGTIDAAITLPVITAKTTLGELLAALSLGKKPKTPTPRVLFETAGEPIAEMNGCTLFRNGFAIYKNGSGRTVVWLPYCVNFTFYFDKLRDSEKDTLRETYELPEEYLKTQPWVIAVTLIGDHRIESNSMNRTGSRKNTVDLASKDKGDKNGAMEEIIADPYRRAFNWYDGHMGENPQDAVERRETREEMLAAMTDKQREVFILYYRDGMTQEQIAVYFNVDQTAVRDRLKGALKKAKKYLR